MREERRAALEAQAGGQPEGLEAQSYQESFEAQQPAYDNGQPSYDSGPTYDDGQTPYANGQAAPYDNGLAPYDNGQAAPYDNGQAPYDNGQAAPYEEQQATYDQQTAYEEPQQGSYDETYFPSNGGYPEPAYAEPVQEEHSGNRSAASETFSAFAEPSYQGNWPKQDTNQSAYRSEYAPEAETSQAADVSEQDRVGFSRPGPAPSAPHALTDAGLPRRGAIAAGNGNGQRPVEQREQTPPVTTKGPDDWRSSNDDRWQRAEQLKKPKAGGVTSSGLPRRVPKANLVEGTAESTPQGGPQVSRAPEDIRGRLSNLRRGVQQGRNAGSETNGQATGNQHSGPDSTYNQER
jgi:hypothetical protein